ncbi:uncharacterized protein LY89DRAFT_743202 [Mollisia scopiformis]|uniref:Uncharacterized protein n=1 Tax=Mollisia scopiformis TaxID=149040 RepID=A0A132B4D3_MOLSC|nr:uncharacterized protein LY89DRAFT_743202 [Mollisia scopiformis]KUJ07201.1 hypothetical protein LY89DRAFT_743202 [Mollisia scopiformis]
MDTNTQQNSLADVCSHPEAARDIESRDSTAPEIIVERTSPARSEGTPNYHGTHSVIEHQPANITSIHTPSESDEEPSATNVRKELKDSLAKVQLEMIRLNPTLFQKEDKSTKSLQAQLARLSAAIRAVDTVKQDTTEELKRQHKQDLEAKVSTLEKELEGKRKNAKALAEKHRADTLDLVQQVFDAGERILSREEALLEQDLRWMEAYEAKASRESEADKELEQRPDSSSLWMQEQATKDCSVIETY